MASFSIHVSNRLENISEYLASMMRDRPLADPLAQEIIIVQGAGMERWLSMELAGKLGVSANVAFYFPNAFIDSIFHRLIDHMQHANLFEPDIMQWKIMGLLSELKEKPGFEPLKQYLGNTDDPLKFYQLSERIAFIFDQYVLFRPEMIFKWEKGEESHWQAMLWRELVKGAEGLHRAGLFKQFVQMSEKKFIRSDDFPERISIFGISALPPFHIDVFAAFSQFTEVSLFLMNPCREYWGDILSDKEAVRVSNKARKNGGAADDLYIEKGNSLLASMGALGRDFFDIVNEYGCDENSFFDEPGEASLIACIQSDVLHMRERGDANEEKTVVAAADTSLQIHSCHSLIREIEVLYDNLLYLFEKYPELLPSDILIMTPDIEAYAPYVHAVFDRPADDPMAIPFSIADRSVKNESGIIETFMAILNINESRFEGSYVLSILESPEICRQFDFTGQALEKIQQWIKGTRIRWGIDKAHRRDMGLPDSDGNTWMSGIRRLLLGYAMPGCNENVVFDILPYDFVEGGDTDILGRFAEFISRLVHYSRLMADDKPVDEWQIVINGILDHFFIPDNGTAYTLDDDSEREIQVLRKAAAELSGMKGEDTAGFDQRIDSRTLRYHLTKKLEKQGFGFGFMTGRVTFCAMLPMRSIPFKIICMIGMNHDAYPRQSGQMGFDLIAQHPRPGDRSRRIDDRYLFLETVLSARSMLYISYVGQNIKDNSQIPPSVLVSELMDSIEQGYQVQGKNILDHILTYHRLQAFSPAYFQDQDDRLFSYSWDYYEISDEMTRRQDRDRLFITGKLPEPADDDKKINLSDLISFFNHPVKYILNRRLGIFYEKEDRLIEDTEPFSIDHLDRYFIQQAYLQKLFFGKMPDHFIKAIHKSGILPHGDIGMAEFDAMNADIISFYEKTNQLIQNREPKSAHIDIEADGFHISGRIDNIYADAMIQYRMAVIKPADFMKAWISHLFLNMIQVDGCQIKTLVAGLKQKPRIWEAWELSPIENSRELISAMLNIYRQGLLEPLVFFGNTSLAYAGQIIEKNMPEHEALISARQKWEGNDFVPGEMFDPYHQRCFSGKDVLNDDFKRNAIGIWAEIIKNRKKV